jgi:hypothetical protein
VYAKQLGIVLQDFGAQTKFSTSTSGKVFLFKIYNVYLGKEVTESDCSLLALSFVATVSWEGAVAWDSYVYPQSDVE